MEKNDKRNLEEKELIQVTGGCSETNSCGVDCKAIIGKDECNKHSHCKAKLWWSGLSYEYICTYRQ